MKKKYPEIMSTLHQTFSHKVQTKLKEDIEELVSNLALKEKLDFLDQLDTEQAESSRGDVVWYTSLNSRMQHGP